MNLRFEAVVELKMHLIYHFGKNFKLANWFGFRLLTIDDSTIRLRIAKDAMMSFGVFKSRRRVPSNVQAIKAL